MPTRSLAIETATDVCSVALAEDGAARAVASLFIPRVQAERLVPLIQSLMEHAGWRATDLDYIAVSAGPGSYTGLRIGLSTAKGLAYSLGAGVVGVSTLEAFALQAAEMASPGDLIVPSFDARRTDVYAAAFEVDGDGGLIPVVEPTADDVQAFAGRIVATRVWLLGDGSSKLALHLPDVPDLRRPSILPSAVSVAALGHARWATGNADDVAGLEPSYMREFIAKKPERSAFEKLPF